VRGIPRLPRIIRRRKPADTSNIGRVFAYFRSASRRITLLIEPGGTPNWRALVPHFLRATLKGDPEAPIPYASRDNSAAQRAEYFGSMHDAYGTGEAAGGSRHQTAYAGIIGQGLRRRMHQPVEDEGLATAPAISAAPVRPSGDLFVWFRRHRVAP